MGARTLLIASLTVAGCYSPAIDPCVYACAAEGTGERCPAGLACNAEGMCAAQRTDRCEAVDDDADVEPSLVTIQVRNELSLPAANATVVFLDSAGALLSEVTTAADGVAQAALETGGSATVIREVETPAGLMAYRVTTFLDVWEGATIISQAEVSEDPQLVTVSWPLGGGMQVVVVASCGAPKRAYPNSPGTGDIDVPARCAAYDVVVMGDPSPVSAVALNQMGTPVVVGAFDPPVQIDGTVMNFPANGFTPAPVSVRLVPTPELPPTVAVASTTVQAETWMLPVPRLERSVMLNVDYAEGGMIVATQTLHRRAIASTTTVPFDCEGVVVPWLMTPVFDRVARAMTWQHVFPANTTAGTPDVISARVDYDTADGVGVSWRVVAPASRITTQGAVHSLVFPDLPDARVFELAGNETVTGGQLGSFGVPDAAAQNFISQFERILPDTDWASVDGVDVVAVSLSSKVTSN